MYIGAALSLWMVRAWKIGELEEKAAIEGRNEDGTEGFKRSAFIKRTMMWRKV
jgi:hypothetical protein